MNVAYSFVTLVGLMGIFALPLTVAWFCLWADDAMQQGQRAREFEERVDGAQSPPNAAVDALLDGTRVATP